MHVRVNAAVSADGKLSTRRREQIEISGPEDFDRVDDIRSSVDAIAVGVGTVVADDPHLVVDGEGSDSPIRVVADSEGRMPPDARILDAAAPTVVLVSDAAPTGRVRRFEAAGAETVVAGDDRVNLATAFETLEDRFGIETMLVEGGGEIIFSLFDRGLVDECSLFVGPMVIGGREAPTLADGEGFLDDFPELSLRSVERLDDGVVLYWDVP
jgi:2,5-diamino-6-(ribosylamino)-4(3H)-pyrimidinone 5'-phosphate reductase